MRIVIWFLTPFGRPAGFPLLPGLNNCGLRGSLLDVGTGVESVVSDSLLKEFSLNTSIVLWSDSVFEDELSKESDGCDVDILIHFVPNRKEEP